MLDADDLGAAADELERITPDQSALLTVPQIAQQLQVYERTVWRWINQGKLKATRLTSRCTRVSRADLDRFITEAPH